jgi:hypothetical protein
MKMNIFTDLLMSANAEQLAPNSRINHHARGLTYLCLHRSTQLTMKIYVLDGARNSNSGFLVHPHSHRYFFETTVLRGHLDHVLFKDVMPGCGWGETFDRHVYDPDTGTPTLNGQRELYGEYQRYVRGERYAVSPHEIHTLRLDLSVGGPVVLALAQGPDVQKTTNLYLPPHLKGRIDRPDTRPMTVAQFNNSRDFLLDLLKYA